MKIGVFGFGCVRQFGSVLNRQRFPISLDACYVVNLCSPSTERIYHGKSFGSRKYTLALQDKTIVKEIYGVRRFLCRIRNEFDSRRGAERERRDEGGEGRRSGAESR